MLNNNTPTIALALSGSGDRTPFYIGFLEVWQESGLPLDYIAACSGGSLVAAAFACGTLPEFKQTMLALNKTSVVKYFLRKKEKGGLYSLDLVEQEMRGFTKGKTFEEVRPHMAFAAVDIESGEEITLCMGDIARAACISCTLPAIFKPVKWGGRTLVDGGLLTEVPADLARQAGMDIIIGVNMRGTKHIFSDRQIQAKKIFNFFKKMLFIEELESLFGWFLRFGDDAEAYDFSENPNFFTVLGKSLDLAVNAKPKDETCDLLITPNIPKKMPGANLSRENMLKYYNWGRESATQHCEQIKELIRQKQVGSVLPPSGGVTKKEQIHA